MEGHGRRKPRKEGHSWQRMKMESKGPRVGKEHEKDGGQSARKPVSSTLQLQLAQAQGLFPHRAGKQSKSGRKRGASLVSGMICGIMCVVSGQAVWPPIYPTWLWPSGPFR